MKNVSELTKVSYKNSGNKTVNKCGYNFGKNKRLSSYGGVRKSAFSRGGEKYSMNPKT